MKASRATGIVTSCHTYFNWSVVDPTAVSGFLGHPSTDPSLPCPCPSSAEKLLQPSSLNPLTLAAIIVCFPWIFSAASNRLGDVCCWLSSRSGADPLMESSDGFAGEGDDGRGRRISTSAMATRNERTRPCQALLDGRPERTRYQLS